MFFAATFLSIQPGCSQDHISLITNSFLKRVCIHFPVQFKHKRYVLGAVWCVSPLRLTIFACVFARELNIFHFNLILGSVFSNEVVFYGDLWRVLLIAVGITESPRFSRYGILANWLRVIANVCLVVTIVVVSGSDTLSRRRRQYIVDGVSTSTTGCQQQ